MRIQESASRLAPAALEVRRYLHQYPELSFKEYKSSEYIASKLTSLGLPCKKIGTGTGIVSWIHGVKKDPSLKTVALRADMDALPIQEENNIDFKSQSPGVMHACGHDAHCAAVFLAACILREMTSHFSGTVKLVFQPAEELCPGGAIDMIQGGVLDGVDLILGEHVNPTLPAGTVGFRKGIMMASADEIYLHVKGRGGHAAIPHELTDPVLITSHIIVALQQIVSRQSRPDVPTVLSFGKISAAGAMNVIPDEVYIAGTFRTLDENWRSQALERISSMAENIAKGMGGDCEVKIVQGYPLLINDAALTQRSHSAAIIYLGEEHVRDLPLVMWSEDFSYYNQKVPGCFYNLGVANSEKGWTNPLHTPTFMIDEAALETAGGLMAWLAFRELLQN